MAFRLKLVPDETKFDFFRHQFLTFGFSVVLVIASIIAVAVMGLNFGIDFRGGTTIRAESSKEVDVGAWRNALQPLDLGDVVITQVFDPSFDADQHVAEIRIQAQNDEGSVSPQTISGIDAALKEVTPDVKFTDTESVGPKV